MKYSTVLLAAFAAGAMARAIPDGDYDPALEEIKNTPGGPDNYDVSKDPSYDDKSKDTDSYDKDHKKDDKKDNYGDDKNSYDKDHKKGDKKDDKKDDSYGKKKDDDSYGKKDYEPVEQKSYEQRKHDEKDNYKTYFPEPKHDDDYEKKSCYDGFKWPKTVRREEKCKIEWKPKHDKVKHTNVYLYRCDKYDAPVKKICDRCEGHSYDDWKPDCDASDVKHGATYRFKFCDADNEDDYTWGSEFPIYGDKVYYEKPENKKVEGQCPPEPAPAPVYEAPAPAPAPEAPSYPAPEAPAAPEAPSYPAPAPVPAPEAPAALVSNETSPEAFASGSSSIFQVSMSVILGVAALVTFAL